MWVTSSKEIVIFNLALQKWLEFSPQVPLQTRNNFRGRSYINCLPLRNLRAQYSSQFSCMVRVGARLFIKILLSAQNSKWQSICVRFAAGIVARCKNHASLASPWFLCKRVHLLVVVSAVFSGIGTGLWDLKGVKILTMNIK